MSSRKRSTWFSKAANQGVFMRVATIPSIAKNGPVNSLTESRPPLPQGQRHFVVGETLVGGRERVGGE